MSGFRAVYKKAGTAPVNKDKPFVIYDPHDGPSVLHPSMFELGADYIRGCFIDPGTDNNSIRISKYNSENGEVVIETEMQMLLDFVKGKIEGKEIEGSDYGMETKFYVNVCRQLDRFMDWFIRCHYIVIESQMPVNYNLTRFGQHLITYFMVNVRNKGFRPIIVEIDSKMKSRMLGAPRMKKPQLKKWTTAKALQILEARGDQKTIAVIMASKKKDDHGDVVCYDEVWWMLMAKFPKGIPRLTILRQ